MFLEDFVCQGSDKVLEKRLLGFFILSQSKNTNHENRFLKAGNVS